MREKIISSLFEFLLNQGIEYAILHHLNNIYDKRSDIDFVTNCNKDRFIEILKTFSLKYNCFLGSNFTIDNDIYRFELFYFSNNHLEKFELDCACNAKGNNILKINSFDLLKEKVRKKVCGNFFFKVSNENEIDYYIKKKAFKGENIELFYDYLRELNGDLNQNIILEKYNFWISYYSSKGFFIKKILFYKKIFLNRIKEKPSLSICFLGPDGSGKTTLIKGIMSKNIFINNYYYHLKPLMKKSISKTSIVTNPHREKQYSYFKSFLKLILFIFQYNYGWFKNIFPLKFKSSLIVFDRYYDDIMVDHRRYRYKGGIRLAKLVRYLIPKPEIYFVLVAEPFIIQSRKKEVEFHELNRQIFEYKRLVDNKRYILIDVSENSNDLIMNISKIIISASSKKNSIP